jgi:hypothetical protein
MRMLDRVHTSMSVENVAVGAARRLLLKGDAGRAELRAAELEIGIQAEQNTAELRQQRAELVQLWQVLHPRHGHVHRFDAVGAVVERSGGDGEVPREHLQEQLDVAPVPLAQRQDAACLGPCWG